jgi:polysaccharide pyruvyl transferase WcaK-like protein
MERVCLITKLVTTNVGNQALSNELIQLLRTAYGRNLVAVIGRPTGLDGYSLDRLKAAGGRPLDVFNGWADSVLDEYNRRKHGYQLSDRTGEIPQVKLIQPGRALSFSETAKRPLRRLRGSLRRCGVYGSAYSARLHTLAHCDQIVYNGAGELRDSNIALRQLLELRVAQKLGCRVVPINHGIVIQDPILKAILFEVYRHCPAIQVRGTHSQELLTEGGVAGSRIQIGYDAAFLSSLANRRTVETVAKRESIVPGTVGIALSGYHTRDVAGWDAIMDALRARNKTVLFVSNDMYQDSAVGAAFQHRYGIRVMSRQYGYEEYIGLLSRLELVISGRLHTSIFAMVGNTPTVPLENCDGKMEEVFRLVDPSIEVVNVRRENWAERGLQSIARIYDSYGSVKSGLLDTVLEIRRALLTSSVPR